MAMAATTSVTSKMASIAIMPTKEKIIALKTVVMGL
jgi:hypothetical protein